MNPEGLRNDKSIEVSFAKKALNFVLNYGSSVFLLVYFLSHFNRFVFVSELLSHFQVFYLCCALFGATLAFFLKKKYYLIIHSIVIVYILSLLIPFYIPDSKDANSSNSMLTLYQVNVKYNNQESELLLEQIKEQKPDIVLLIETGALWGHKTALLKDEYPYEFKALNDVFGFILYSKLPIKSCELLNFNTKFDCLDAIIDWDGKEIRLIGVHPPPPIDKNWHTARNTHLLGYAELVKQKKEIPTIIMGDFNITPWSYHYKKLMEDADLFSTRKGFGMLATWPSILPYKIPIDHCLLTKHFGVIETKILPSIQSDHLPMLQKIYVKPSP